MQTVPLPGGEPDPNLLPDLIVSDLFLNGNEVRFKVRNIGSGEKRPATMNYALSVQLSGAAQANYTGIAAITSLYRLRPNEETDLEYGRCAGD